MINTTPKTFWQILEENDRDNHFNISFNNLNREIFNINQLEDKNYSVIGAIHKVLLDHGQKKFIHLSPGFRESMVAVALYCGDGLVAKVIPANASDKLPDITDSGFGRAAFLLPSIKSVNVEGNGPVTSFKVKFYPFLAANHITVEDVEKYRKKVQLYGLDVKDGDEKLINFKRLPDKDHTITGIDSDMLEVKNMARFNSSEEEVEKWLNHVKKIFPIYNSQEINSQHEKTNFALEPLLMDPKAAHLSYNVQEKVAASKGSWTSFLGF